MGMSALAIHLANGVIEAHFELFVLLALLIVFGKQLPILVAGATIALHHVLFWLWLPTSVFNYKASFGMVLVHAFFVILEVVPACWIARQFGRSIRVQGIVMEHLGGSAEQVNASAREISQASGKLADAACRQASTIQETSSSSVEMNSGTTNNLATSDELLNLIASMDSQLGKANHDLSSMQAVVSEMVQSSKKISKVVKLIDGIAFQTNILSLNAAVEAAAAGAAGAGFSVVAKEVGSLAQKSAMAATDTATLIAQTLQTTLTGESAVEALGSAMSRVTETAVIVRAKIAALRSACQGQDRAASIIRQSISELGNSAQETAAVAEQSAAAGVCLTDQAVTLREIVLLLQA
jgi:methyl-accepting chemotaxis protein